MASTRGEQAARRRLARQALTAFGIERASLRLLRHEHNTTYRVDTAGSSFVLRINRPGVHGPATIASELAWLRALASGTDLGVPEPVNAADGSPVVTIPWDGDARAAVLLRWQDGRFVDARLMPRHLRQVAALQGGLQRHGETWDRPDGFVRPRVETLSTPAKRRSISSGVVPGSVWPTTDDAAETLSLVTDLLSRPVAAVVASALDAVGQATAELAAVPGAVGLIHADLHYENFLFHDGVARAIDFDDCGWGFYLYDVAVTLWELEERASYEQLRDAFLDEYARHRPLPPNHDALLQALFVLRRVQMLMWVLESRDHAAFRDGWVEWAGEEVDAITAAVRRLRSRP